MKIYIGGSITGQTYEEASKYFDTTKFDLKQMGYYVYSPLTAKGYLRTEIKPLKAGGYNYPISTNHAIFERDRWCVQQADIFYLNLMLSGTRVSIGGIMELAWASALGKHTIVSLPEDNIHRHAFVLEAADIIFNNHEETMVYLDHLIHQDS